MNKLFGTDGIRGNADEFPLDNDTVWVIGRSLTDYFGKKTGKAPKFLIGRDTRESGERIEAAFCSGAHYAGALCESAGVITTPGVAYLAKTGEFDAGIVISASHNAYHDNGIKIFSPSGQKLGRDVEEMIEAAIKDNPKKGMAIVPVDSSKANEYQEEYLHHFEVDFGGLDLSKLRIAVDCANGAASDIAPRLFDNLGAEVAAINYRPDGRNINKDCGSLHLERLRDEVLKSKADFGVAFDGDADRALFVDENGAVVDGDATLWIMANHLKKKSMLNDDTVVATVMSNIGLEIALRSRSISLIRSAVGDKYVLEEIVKSGSSIGGEQSGHIIFPSRSLVGDGIQTALFMLQAVTESKGRFSDLLSGFQTFPQILVNVKVSKKMPFEEVPEIEREKYLVEEELGPNGRLLLRYSGTENLARVMIEGTNQSDVDEKAHRLASAIEKALG